MVVPNIQRLAAALVLLAINACDAPPLAQTCAANGNALPAAVTAGGDVWPNEPPGLTTLTSDWKCEGDGISVQSNELVFTYPAGFQSGYAPGVAYLDIPAPTPESYFGFWWKPSSRWQSHPSGVNKIALLFPSTSGAGTIVMMMFHDGGTYTIQVEPTFESDSRRLAPNRTATPVVLGAWHQIEWYVRYSSNPSSGDGVVRWWVDGVLQGEYTDLQMPPDAGFTQYTIRPVWGGAVGDAKVQTDSFSYGRVHISKR